MTLTSIFAAVGQFPQDDAVLARAVEIAATLSATLTIVHIIDLSGFDGDLADRDTLHWQAALAARDRIEAALVRQSADASDTEIRIESGSPALKSDRDLRRIPTRSHRDALPSEKQNHRADTRFDDRQNDRSGYCASSGH